MSAVDIRDDAPNLGLLYAKAAVTAVIPGGSADLPDTTLVLDDVTVDPQALATYDRVCGFRLGSHLPATYPHIVAFPLSVELMASRTFPFALPGLVHVTNSITQRRPIATTEAFRLTVSTEDLRAHPKGRQFDVVATAAVDGDEVWSSRSTYLKRGGGDDAARTLDPDGPSGSRRPQAEWRVPSDIGRRYGAVSGDRNPIHMSPVTAKLFGFPRHIAHGMWTAARCLAAMEGELPDAFTYDVAFKRPVLLPAKVAFTTEAVADGWRLSVADASKGTPHLVGTITG
jgi:acyl dehydratase